MIKTSKHCV